MKQAVINQITKYYNYYLRGADFSSHAILLLTRIWVGVIFFKSGKTKISSWDNTLDLFEYHYEIPLLPTQLAAVLATGAELICPVLLFAGIISRVSVLPIFIMTLIIEFLVIQNSQHFYWMFMMGVIMIFGSGKLSADYFLEKKFKTRI